MKDREKLVEDMAQAMQATSGGQPFTWENAARAGLAIAEPVIAESMREKALEALLWAWTQAMGRLPDKNTMSESEIADYLDKYVMKIGDSINALTGFADPDEYLMFMSKNIKTPLTGEGE